ncbi:MAG: hypothetical protein ABSA23_05415 [Anaerolineales bacterium]
MNDKFDIPDRTLPQLDFPPMAALFSKELLCSLFHSKNACADFIGWHSEKEWLNLIPQLFTKR